MMVTLTKFPKVRYTMMELHMFDTMPKDGTKVRTADIAAACAEIGGWKVKYPLKNVTVTMNRLMGKIKLNREKFRLAKAGKRPGHSEVEYWIEQK
jgi:hypothetical protein